MSVRRRALEALNDITEKGAYSNLALKRAASGVEERDARWITAAVYTTLENKSYIDYIIAHYAKGKQNAVIAGILRLGVSQALYMDVPLSASCNESVKLAKETGKGALSGYVNGVMRAVCRDIDDGALPPLPEDTVLRLAVQSSYPRFIVEEYVGRFGEEFTRELILYKDTGVTIRAQRPYTTDMLMAELERRGTVFERGRMVPDALRLEGGFDATKEKLFTHGSITVQSESAMLACRALELKPGMRVLDACAAPGGKTAYIAQLLGGSGGICAWELHEHRAELTRRTLERLGVKNATVEVRDACEPEPAFERTFDAVLVDAPCSGFGVFGKPDVRLNRTDDSIDELSGIQKRLLQSCSRYVRGGGRLVYSTCTISQRENENVTAAFLEENAEFEPCDISSAVPDGLKDEARAGAIQLFPHIALTEGFFIAAFRRRREVES